MQFNNSGDYEQAMENFWNTHHGVTAMVLILVKKLMAEYISPLSPMEQLV